MRSCVLTLSLAIICGFTLGCGRSPAGGQASGVPARGTVQFEKRPAAGAILLFHRTGTGLPPRAAVRPDGGFEFAEVDGLFEGNYVVTVEWRQGSDENGADRRSVVPDRYTRKESSPLKVTVRRGPDGRCDLGIIAITK